jgi:hypothetical protein
VEGAFRDSKYRYIRIKASCIINCFRVMLICVKNVRRRSSARKSERPLGQSRVAVAGLSHGSQSRVAVTGRSNGSQSRVAVTGRSHGSQSRAREVLFVTS